MSFRVSARTILHLGRDLISSDFVAVYELMKNGLDAIRDRQASDIRDRFKSRRKEPDRVELDVLVRIPHNIVVSIKEKLEELQEQENTAKEKNIEALGAEIIKVIDPQAPKASKLCEEIRRADSCSKLLRVLTDSNTLTVRDWGKGMSFTDLNKVYLLIGTANRVGKKSRQRDGPVYFGEKGIGRLSAMRLGDRLYLKTTQRGEQRWNELEIDWTDFERSDDDLVEKINIEPRLGAIKDDPSECGTSISVTALRSEWDKESLPRFVREHFSRLVDPFTASLQRPVKIFFNEKPVIIPRFNKILFKTAHAVLTARYTTEPPCLKGEVLYRGQKKEFNLDTSDLITCAERKKPVGEAENIVKVDNKRHLPPLALVSLGPFALKVYWYNRRILGAIAGIGSQRDVRAIVNDWSGGVMVFRDGFRVLPYGSPDDDWLDLDKIALASRGYKVNRRQVIGRIRITRNDNKSLADQTNREGLRDSPEKFVLIAILQYVLRVEMKTFLNRVDKELKKLQGIPEIKDRWAEAVKRLHKTLKLLAENFPEVQSDEKIMQGFSEVIPVMEKAWSDIEKKSSDLENRLDITLNLAGIGLLLENIEHELSRSIAFALKEVAHLNRHELPGAAGAIFKSLRQQLVTIEKRLLTMKPMSTARRGRKKYVSINGLAQMVLTSREGQFKRHDIDCQLCTLPKDASALKAKVVEGQLVQVFENLLDNSVYWLKEDRKNQLDFKPVIRVTIHAEEKKVSFYDNGRGVPVERREEVFEPFFSMKPANEKKGLGLYISREIANYHGMSLFLSEERGEDGRLHTFIFSLEEKKR